ncbi:hypothetical protein [Maioricimonas rarisocia]|uniref:hypothetical protein n=1 Tax=Maioricimonas rarisocia TaxID=2528026 RepID=UPI0011A016BD|nr:hypothetical protein [Maioricimonas rarisocia]
MAAPPRLTSNRGYPLWHPIHTITSRDREGAEAHLPNTAGRLGGCGTGWLGRNTDVTHHGPQSMQ